MARKRQSRQPYSLNSEDVSHLAREEIALVLRAANDLIALGGRSLLVKVLRGSEAQDVRPELRHNPAYGVWREVPQTLVSQRVDWCIQQGYLDLNYFGKLPLLVYPPKGLTIAAQTFASEWAREAVQGYSVLRERLKAAPLPTQFALLDQIAESRSESYQGFLADWSKDGTKRLRSRIHAIHAEWNGTGPRRRYVFDNGWLDEGVGDLVLNNFVEYARKHTILCAQTRLLVREFPGLADVEIYRRLLLHQNACFVTEDRAFHNALCQKRVSSFLALGDGRFQTEPIPGVAPRGILAKLNQQKPASPPPCGQSEPALTAHPLHALILPDSIAALKRLRTKRRRIRNFFGGIAHMKRCSVALSLHLEQKPLLGGIRIRVLPGDTGVTALDATELFVRELSNDPLGFYIQAIVLLIQLQLWELPVDIYFDSRLLPEPDSLKQSLAYPFWLELIGSLPGLNFKPIGERPRSPHMDTLRQKLAGLTSRKTNEIVSADIRKLVNRWRESKNCAAITSRE